MSEPNAVPEEAPEETPEEAPGEPTEPAEPSEEDQAEEETPEAPEAPEEPAEDQPQAFSEKEWEQASDKLKREAKRHWDRVTEIMGVEMRVLTECPMCDDDIPGAIMLTPDVPQRFPAVREFMGDAQPRELQPDPNAARCETCRGEGVVDTGSRVQGQSELPCETCGGKGWRGSRGTVAAPPQSAPAPPAVSNGPIAPAVTHEDQAEIERLRAKGIVVIVPAPSPAPVA